MSLSCIVHRLWHVIVMYNVQVMTYVIFMYNVQVMAYVIVIYHVQVISYVIVMYNVHFMTSVIAMYNYTGHGICHCHVYLYRSCNMSLSCIMYRSCNISLSCIMYRSWHVIVMYNVQICTCVYSIWLISWWFWFLFVRTWNNLMIIKTSYNVTNKSYWYLNLI